MIKNSKKTKSNIQAAKNKEGGPQTVELARNDVAIVLRGDGRCETICTLKGKHTLTPQEEIIIGLGGLLQQEIFVTSIRDHFYKTMQNMLTSKYTSDMSID